MKKLIEIIKEQGCVEVTSGVYLNSQENIIADQAGWDDEDPSKGKDFTGFAIWLTTDSGWCEGFGSVEEYLESIEETVKGLRVRGY